MSAPSSDATSGCTQFTAAGLKRIVGQRSDATAATLFGFRNAFIFFSGMIIAQCVVCQELLESVSEKHLSALPCGHIFHGPCIETWFKRASTCPQCRVSVRRTQVIKKLFFSSVDRASTSILLPEIVASMPSCGDDINTGDSAFLAMALNRAKCEIKRLANETSTLQTLVKSTEKKLADRETELEAISSLYKETDRLYSEERQKCKQAKLELSSYRTILQEAESIKAEGLKLRQQVVEMKDIQTLIGSSEKAAFDLLNSYMGHGSEGSSDSSSPIATICRWASILRTELSSARNRARKYRTDANRFQRAQSEAAKRVLEAEAKAAEYKGRVSQLQAEMAALVSSATLNAQAPSNPTTPSTVSVANAAAPLPSTSAEPSTPANENNLGLQTCLRYIDLSTPEIASITQDDTGDVGNKTFKMTKITPHVNPFKLDDSLAMTPCGRRLGTADEISTPRLTTALREQTEADVDRRQLPGCVAASRRPSSLFQLAIMRNLARNENHRHPKAIPYNGLGGQESNTGPTSLFVKPSPPNRSAADPLRNRLLSKNTTKYGVKNMASKRHINLDKFLTR
uniref:RING-type domain-containing protein n=1 Tax=Mesocestoides corti TaxID=53468 RepID=A0A5K3ETA3_MESCO